MALFGREQKILSWISCLHIPSTISASECREAGTSGRWCSRGAESADHWTHPLSLSPSLLEAFALAVLWALAKKSICALCSLPLGCGFFLPFLQRENDITQEYIVKNDWIHLWWLWFQIVIPLELCITIFIYPLLYIHNTVQLFREEFSARMRSFYQKWE